MTTGQSSPGRSGAFMSSLSMATASVAPSTAAPSAGLGEPRAFGFGAFSTMALTRSARSQRTTTTVVSCARVSALPAGLPTPAPAPELGRGPGLDDEGEPLSGSLRACLLLRLLARLDRDLCCCWGSGAPAPGEGLRLRVLILSRADRSKAPTAMMKLLIAFCSRRRMRAASPPGPSFQIRTKNCPCWKATAAVCQWSPSIV
mmetsp:Transcript_25637/g.80261  ORF Transcript_25637/g.80261 Transcript_25637/m.80261 type:complete len:202 (+) Transcript_25637:572-1177(+)